MVVYYTGNDGFFHAEEVVKIFLSDKILANGFNKYVAVTEPFSVLCACVTHEQDIPTYQFVVPTLEAKGCLQTMMSSGYCDVHEPAAIFIDPTVNNDATRDTIRDLCTKYNFTLERTDSLNQASFH